MSTNVATRAGKLDGELTPDTCGAPVINTLPPFIAGRPVVIRTTEEAFKQSLHAIVLIIKNMADRNSVFSYWHAFNANAKDTVKNLDRFGRSNARSDEIVAHQYGEGHSRHCAKGFGSFGVADLLAGQLAKRRSRSRPEDTAGRSVDAGSRGRTLRLTSNCASTSAKSAATRFLPPKPSGHGGTKL